MYKEGPLACGLTLWLSLEGNQPRPAAGGEASGLGEFAGNLWKREEGEVFTGMAETDMGR